MLIVIKLFAKDSSEFDLPEMDSPMSSSSELEEEPEESELDDQSLLGAREDSHRVAIGVFRKSVEHAFCATLYASCLFFPVHLSWKRK